MLDKLRFWIIPSMLLMPLSAQSAPPELKNYFPELAHWVGAPTDFPEDYYDFCEKKSVFTAKGPIVPPYQETIVTNNFDEQGRVTESKIYHRLKDGVIKHNRTTNFSYESANSRTLKSTRMQVIDYQTFLRTFERDAGGRILGESTLVEGTGERNHTTYSYNERGQLVEIDHGPRYPKHTFTPGLPAKGKVQVERSFGNGTLERITLNFDKHGHQDFSQFAFINEAGTVYDRTTNRYFEDGFLVKELEDNDSYPVPTSTVYQYNSSGRVNSMVTEVYGEGTTTREVSTFNYDCHN